MKVTTKVKNGWLAQSNIAQPNLPAADASSGAPGAPGAPGALAPFTTCSDMPLSVPGPLDRPVASTPLSR